MSEGNKGIGWGKGILIAVGGLFGLSMIGAINAPDDKSANTGSAEAAAIMGGDAPMMMADSSAEPSTAALMDEEEAQPRMSGPQANAVRSANQYLNMSGFSKKGLIEQLSSEYGDGYSVADATAAVNSLDVDWNDNAARSARQYLDMTGFSCSGLVEQLSSSAGDDYTVEQANFGAREAGAC